MGAKRTSPLASADHTPSLGTVSVLPSAVSIAVGDGLTKRTVAGSM